MAVKAKRVKRDGSDVNDYEVTCGNGAVISATSNGKGKFDCPALGLEGAMIKTIKQMAEWYDEDGDTAPIADEPAVDTDTTFACLHPCALICLHLIVPGEPISMVVLQTLDAYGWLTPEQQPDIARAQREYEAHKQTEVARAKAMHAPF